MFITAATAMLASYPEHVVERVCDPIRGLPSRNKFLPAIAEIREDCEREMIWHDAVERRERARRHTAGVLAPPPPRTPDARRRVRAEADTLIAEFGGLRRREIDFLSPRSPDEAEAARRHFEARLPELAAEYAAKPLGGEPRQADKSGEAPRVDSGATPDVNFVCAQCEGGKSISDDGFGASDWETAR
jgi:hypothetical protein